MNPLDIDASEENTRAAYLLAWGIHPSSDSKENGPQVNERGNSALPLVKLANAWRASTTPSSLAEVDSRLLEA